MSPARVPATVVAGALGVGKTTALLALAAHQPPDERWVVLVNEFGEVGIDGAVLGDAAGLSVAELPGGCLCCAGQAPMEITLAQILSELSPDRVLIEPSGVADAGAVLDTLLGAFADRIDLRATITLVDPRALTTPRGRHRSAWEAQVQAADVLVGNRIDACAPAEVRAFLEWGAALWPPKRAVVTTVGGELDPAWLDWTAQAASQPAAPGSADHAHHDHAVGALEQPAWVDQTGLLPADLGARVFRRAWAGPDYTTCGWRLPAALRLRSAPLRALLAGLVDQGALRVKGVFHTSAGWQVLQADRDGVRATPTAWRRDSRLEVLAAPAQTPDWVAVDRALLACAAPPA